MKYKPVSYKQVFIICACRFSEPVCFSVIFPFIVSMVKDLDISRKEDVGYYVGMISAVFSLSQLLTGIPYGILSDRIGRRPVILWGMIGTMISITLFGFSKSFMWALISRSLCGLLNGNVGVMKSMVAEMTLAASPEERTRAFSFLPLMSGLGYIIGPLLGGFLAKPVEHYPSIFGNLGSVTDFLVYYPYFLPCAISALICGIGFIFGIFFLEETLGGGGAHLKKHEDEQQQQQPLLGNTESSSSTSYRSIEDDHQQDPPPPTLKEALTPTVWAVSISFAILNYQVIFCEELFAIWTASQRSFGGLGFDTNEIGMAMSVAGCATLVTQLILLPPMVKRFGFVQLYRSTLFALIFIYLSHGFIRFLYGVPNWWDNGGGGGGQTESKDWVWVGLLLVVTIKTMAQTTAVTSCTLLINNCAPSRCLGAINGFAFSCGAFMRALSPASCGILWSLSVSATWLPLDVRTFTTWIFLGSVAAITYYTGQRLDATKYETVQDQQDSEDDEHSHRDDTV